VVVPLDVVSLIRQLSTADDVVFWEPGRGLG
jgi:hypothetical protein